jgi:hypothetical protein
MPLVAELAAIAAEHMRRTHEPTLVRFVDLQRVATAEELPAPDRRHIVVPDHV